MAQAAKAKADALSFADRRPILEGIGSPYTHITFSSHVEADQAQNLSFTLIVRQVRPQINPQAGDPRFLGQLDG